MEIKLKRLPKAEAELEIEIGPEMFEGFFETALSKLAKNLELPGFRKGKVPLEIALREIGEEKILMEAARLAVRESYLQAISEKKLEVISQPRIEILKLARKNPFRFRVLFAILPEIELPDYKKIASGVKRKKISVEDSEIKDTLTWLQKSRPTIKEIKRGARKDDFVEIEFSSPQIDNGIVQKDAFLLGKGHLIPGFEDKLKAMKKGEKKRFSLRVPQEHFRQEIAGKEIDFKVRMLKVSETELPEINDEFARSLGNFKNLEALKQSIKEGIRTEKELAESRRIREEILTKTEKECKFEIPEMLIEMEKQRMLETLKNETLKNLNLSFEEYLARIKKTKEELLISFQAEAQKRVKRFLTLREIAKKEKIEVLEEEITEGVSKILSQYPDMERAKKEIDPERLRSYTEEAIRNEKTLARLESFAGESK